MAALQPPEQPPGGEGPPLPGLTRSFVAVTASSSIPPLGQGLDIGVVSLFRGEPTLCMTREVMLRLAEPFHNALVGRFAFSRPPMELIRKFVTFVGLKGECSVGVLDSNHVLIRRSTEEDYTQLLGELGTPTAHL